MAYNDVLTLVSTDDLVADEYGDRVVVTGAGRQVYCERSSIGMTEFYQAEAVGFRPEIKFKLADYLEYMQEPIVLYQDRRYNVLRTFVSGQTIELVCQSEVNPS